MPTIYNLELTAPTDTFPDPQSALESPNGLLAIGGDLDPRRLLQAYYQGIFPWFSEEDPILWWSPNPRCVFPSGDFSISRSLRKSIRNKGYKITVDTAFETVVKACAEPTSDRPETWITEEIVNAYSTLHNDGYAHSIECWLDETLVGGLYGVAMGRVFCGESMFSRASDASKVCFVTMRAALNQAGYTLIDAQIPNPHLERLGAILIERECYLAELDTQRDQAPLYSVWDNRHINIQTIQRYIEYHANINSE